MNRWRQTSAFTLLELLVAVVITLALAGLMLAVTVNVLSLWRRTQDRQTQTVAANLVFAALELDLQSAIHRRDATEWLAAEIVDTKVGLANHGWLMAPAVMKPDSGGSLLPLPPAGAAGGSTIGEARFGLSGIWLRFVGTNVESGGSVPALLAYQVVRRPVVGDPTAANPAPARYGLYRTAVSAADTFALGYAVTSPNYASADNSPYDNSSARSRDPRNVMNPGHASLLASNIVDFGCWLYKRNELGTLVRIYPGGVGDRSHVATGNSAVDDSRFPDAADLMLRVLSEEGATLIEALESGRLGPRPASFSDDAAWWWGIAEKHSQVFVRRVVVKGGAL
ncbi:MAG: type II secretion system protein [Opitutae bacterium]|nr:type II secretion system protein [Opitutae bacterium]